MSKKEDITLSSKLILGLLQSVLSKHLDNPRKSPKFHLEAWDLCCDMSSPYVAIAAPRGHCKSTAITFAYVLACILFRVREFVLLVSATESLAQEHLGNVYNALVNNKALLDTFNNGTSFHFYQDTKTDIIVRCYDGHEFRIVAKGSEQRVRGVLWNGRRPDLIIGDDLEEDEQVANQERREKFRKWFMNALLPALAEDGVVRIVGTILHFDSLLERLMKNSTWVTRCYRAHNEDFSQILWPGRWTKEKLEKLRQSFVEEGNLEGYYQEYLNYPLDVAASYFKKAYFKPMQPIDRTKPKEFYIGVDLALSKQTKANYSVFIVASIDSNATICVEHVVRERMDSLEVIDTFFELQAIYNPMVFIAESENIFKTIGPILNDEMVKRNVFINIYSMVPHKDKLRRARSIQAKMKLGCVKFDTEAPWYDTLYDELIKFDKGVQDDQVDALAWIGLYLDKMAEASSQEEQEQAQFDEEFNMYMSQGQSLITGY